ncbi:MAG TPA: glutamine--fructose-6-phosphate aminotransferase, partial [Xanthomonadales bacterium]|nr:glutamine--fructose-6-phosphate aminotransferase [Xanthomonadales bacterium]
ADMPVIAVAPNDHLIDKLKSNLEEVRARGGELYAFVDEGVAHDLDADHVLTLPTGGEFVAP